MTKFKRTMRTFLFIRDDGLLRPMFRHTAHDWYTRWSTGGEPVASTMDPEAGVTRPGGWRSTYSPPSPRRSERQDQRQHPINSQREASEFETGSDKCSRVLHPS
ncbi:hypothetical protein BCAR13_80108 [Paraburkholderia caribensis]|nr:hypothetical protein BCAR13_80108 [Paraburkholderia caribensis]